MYLKKEEYTALSMVALGEAQLPQKTLLKLLATIEERQEKLNKKTFESINEKRKVNPNYGRPEREWRKKK